MIELLLKDIKKEIQKAGNPEKAKFLMRFFKTKEGQYGHGDLFLGLTVPQSRIIAQKYKDLALSDVQKLLESKYHEERLIALLILVRNFQKGSKELQKKIFDLYLANTDYINNWDLVDLSADKIVGGYLLDKKDRSVLVRLTYSENVWDRRIAIIATFQFIKTKKEYKDTFRISEILLNDKHDLIHKAVGWMLREVGKRCSAEVLVQFLNKHYKVMPRTMLRYAIEHFPEKIRRNYIEGKV